MEFCAAAAEATRPATLRAHPRQRAPAHDPPSRAASNRCQRYEQSAAFHEALYFRQARVAIPPVMSSDSAAYRSWESARFLEGHGASASAGFDLLPSFEIDVAIEKHIQVLTKISRANVFVEHTHRERRVDRGCSGSADGVGVRPGHQTPIRGTRA